MDATPEQLEGLFPLPATNLPTPVVNAPIRHAGVSPESTEAVLADLKENHTRWHIFFNEKHYHKYVSARALVHWPDCTLIIFIVMQLTTCWLFMLWEAMPNL